MFRTLSTSLVVVISLVGCQSVSGVSSSTDSSNLDDKETSLATTNADVDFSSYKSAYDYNEWQHDWYSRNGGSN